MGTFGGECLNDFSFNLDESTYTVPFAAQDLATATFNSAQSRIASHSPASYWGCAGVNVMPCGSINTYYKMIARDPDCSSLTYVSWVVVNTPDATGANYTGTRCGSNPLVDIAIEAKWEISS